MKEYFISEINIEKLYHLSNITIELDTTKRQHLLLTGKNGSGKTSLLLRLVRYLKVLKDGHLIRLTRTWPETKMFPPLTVRSPLLSMPSPFSDLFCLHYKTVVELLSTNTISDCPIVKLCFLPA